MTLLKLVRLCGVQYRLYSTRNILTLKKRGLIKDFFPATSEKSITDLLNKSPQCVYAGFDPTADSLHIGNLLVIINLLHWQRGGHKVIALLGGATGNIGDPSGRKTERKKLEKSYVHENIVGIRKNIDTIFSNHERYFWKNDDHLSPVQILNNEDWYKEMNAVDFVSDLGRHFRMGTMLLKQSVQSRVNSEIGMSFTEFTYQIFQAYDWLHLCQKYNCRFQVGGSDQMGNILAGHDLINRFERDQVYGITLPIITTEEGDKFGKSAGNAIWLDGSKTSPFNFYQFFVRIKDSEIEKLLMYFTFFSVEKIAKIMKTHKEEPEKLIAQKTLAEFLTTLVHGDEGLKKAIMITDALYSKNIEDILKLSQSEICEVFENASTVSLLLEPGMCILDLAMKAKCFPTINDAMRIIKAGGFYINHQKSTNFEEVLTESAHIMPNRVSLLRVGKRNYHIVKWI